MPYPPVVAAIFAATPNSAVRQAMLLGSDLESSWNDNAVGDQGTSFGPFQIHLPAHPGVTAAEAEDPNFAARYMEPAYRAGAAAQGDLWGTDPERAAEQAAFMAERPAQTYYASDGVAVVNQKWSQVQAVMKGQPITPPPNPPGPGGQPGPTTTSIWDFFSPAAWLGVLEAAFNSLVTGVEKALIDTAVTGGVLLAGAGLIALGIWKASAGPRRQVTETVQGAAQTAGPAAAAVAL